MRLNLIHQRRLSPLYVGSASKLVWFWSQGVENPFELSGSKCVVVNWCYSYSYKCMVHSKPQCVCIFLRYHRYPPPYARQLVVSHSDPEFKTLPGSATCKGLMTQYMPELVCAMKPQRWWSLDDASLTSLILSNPYAEMSTAKVVRNPSLWWSLATTALPYTWNGALLKVLSIHWTYR